MLESKECRRTLLALAVVALAAPSACGGASKPRIQETVTAVPEDREPSITTEREEPPKADPFQPTSGPGDAPVPYVRDERSSRLDVPLPRGRGREQWRVPLGGTRREPCRGTCSPARAVFVLVAGNRVAVVGGDEWVLFDTNGRRVDGGKIEGPVRLDRVSGLVVPDENRPADIPPDVRVAGHGGLVATVKEGSVSVGERAVEGKFDAFDVAIDENDVAWVVVRQSEALAVWTVPVSAQASIGRHRIASGARRAIGPPLLGKRVRVLPLDNGFVAVGADGKRVWERRGVPSGGASITSDDVLLVADNGALVAIDARGRATELWKAKDVVFVSPPIVNAGGLVFVVSGEFLHAISFS